MRQQEVQPTKQVLSRLRLLGLQWFLRPGVWGKWCQKLYSGNVQRPYLTSWKHCFMKVHFQNFPQKKC